MATPRIPNSKRQYDLLNTRLKGYLKRVQQLYDTYTTKAAHIASRADFNPEGGKLFSFSDYPKLKGAVDDLLNAYMSGVSANIMRGTSEEWKNSNEFQNLIANKALKTYGISTKSGEAKERYYQSNPDRLKAFQQRKDGGMNLSRRVWNLKEQFKQELELGLSVGIEHGKSANDLAREMKKYLNEPDKLFRRVRDKYGQLQLSKAAKAYHPGRGVYRSSFKNAQRLTRSEINMSYRTAEQVRWQQFDFVLGYEIKLSKSHPCEDVCDKLAGKYPKTFKWTGWHPNDLCYCIPILKSEEEFFSLDNTPSPNEVTDVPQAFKDWVKDNTDRIETAENRSTQAYFIRDNKQTVDSILKPQIVAPNQPPHIEEYVSHYNGKVLTSPLHGSNELADNLRIAKKVSDLLGNTVYLLPRIDPKQRDADTLRKKYLPEGVFEGKNPDFLIPGMLADGKTITFNENRLHSREKIKQTIENHIKRAKKQADNMFFYINGNIPKEWIDQTIMNYLNRSKVNRMIIYFLGGEGYIHKK